MNKIIDNVMKSLNKASTLTEIKEALRRECEKASYPIREKDWQYMIGEILYELA